MVDGAPAIVMRRLRTVPSSKSGYFGVVGEGGKLHTRTKPVSFEGAVRKEDGGEAIEHFEAKDENEERN